MDRSAMDKPGDAGHSDNESNPLFFYMPDAAYGELCQWYPSSFNVSKSQISSLIERPLVDDENDDSSHSDNKITFNCAEQFMMYCKAGRFCDRDTQRRVLASASPKEQKRLGKLTEGFTDESWDEVKGEVVVAGNMAKFGQDVKLKRKLLATGDRLLVEAASRDRVWGIGYAAKHAMSYRQHWGENRLGRALMEVRERLRTEEEATRDGESWKTAALVASSEE